MSKIDDSELRGLPQELVDFKDQVTELLNFGKYQLAVLAARPTHVGRRGEIVIFQDTTGGSLYYMSSDGTTNGWIEMTTWTF